MWLSSGRTENESFWSWALLFCRSKRQALCYIVILRELIDSEHSSVPVVFKLLLIEASSACSCQMERVCMSEG